MNLNELTPWFEEHGGLLLIPIVGALIGWVTNYIAVKMLFHPRKPVNLLLFTLHGIFPKRQAALAEKLGSVVSTELLSTAEIVSYFSQRADSEDVLKLVNARLEHFIRRRLPEVMPMVAFILTDDVVQMVKQVLGDEMKVLLPEIVREFTGSLEQDIDIKKIVEEKVKNYSSDELERLLFSIMKKEFTFVELIGGVVGFLIGIIQVLYIIAISPAAQVG